MKPHLCTPVLAGLILGAGPAVLANDVDPNLIAYDGMDYPLMIDFEVVPGFVIQIPNSLEGNNGGVGWAAPWSFVETIQGKGSPATNTSLIFDPANPGEDQAFAYSGPLQTTGKAVHLDPSDPNNVNGATELARQLATPILDPQNTRTYISFLGRRTGPAVDPLSAPYNDPATFPEGYPWPNNLYPRGAALRIYNSGVNSEGVQGTPGEILQIGHYSDVFGTNLSVNPDVRNTWEIAAGPIVESDVTFTDLTLVVARIDHNGDRTVADSLYVWFNPDISQPEDTANAQISLPNWTITEMVEGVETQVPQDFSDIKFMCPWAGHASGDRPHAEFLFDELRIGKTWESVTPGGAVVPKYGPWPIVSSVYIDSGSFLGWMNISGQPYLWNLTLNKYLYIPQNIIGTGGSWVYIPNPVTPPGGEGTWAGWPIVSGGYADTGDFFSWLYVASGDWVWSVTFNKYIYLPQSYVTASGAWAYIPL